jgi:hypothetical protein
MDKRIVRIFGLFRDAHREVKPLDKAQGVFAES